MAIMAEEIISSRSPTAPAGYTLRRAQTVDESAQSKNRSSTNRLTPNADISTSGPARRRSSNISDYSLNELRKNFQSSTDDLLLPRPSSMNNAAHDPPSNWHSAPLAFALLPAIGGMLFQNGSAIVTDIMLLGLAAIFLNWSVRIPWDWYYSAQGLRKKEEYSMDTVVDDDSGDESHVDDSHAPLENVPEESPAPQREKKKPIGRFRAHEKASNELYSHELLALFSCFLFPVIGAYLLHSIRGYLSRPSEGLVSNYNLTIFLLASELRPVSHLFKLVQARTLHLQRVVHINPYDNSNGETTGDVRELIRRVDELESHNIASAASPANGAAEATISGKQAALITTEVRRALQPELDALNRAVRRYEKRATIQTMQTESRLLDLEGRLSDAISLAAAAAHNGQKSRLGLWSMVIEWIASGVVIPLQAFGALASLPFKSIMALIGFGKAVLIGKPPEKGRRVANGRPDPHGRIGSDRLQGKISRR